MERMIFCNIGWMSWYKGLAKHPDKIVGGGSYVRENDRGHEVCNFLPCKNGTVYGHVESIKGKIDRQIRIENWGGGNGGSLSGIILIWMATHPTDGGRRVVGWYQNAKIFRNRQKFDESPSPQHSKDKIVSYRIQALAADVYLLNVDQRTLRMPKGKGWMGQTPWWSPQGNSAKEVDEFIQSVHRLIGGQMNEVNTGEVKKGGENKSPDTAKDPYVRYIHEHEITISPKHNQLQSRFEDFLQEHGATNVQANRASVDVQYQDPNRGHILVEIKPCENANARYAVRTAIGQLLDYQQRAEAEPSLLIVIEVEPTEEDIHLATGHGFGIAYPRDGGFDFVWPISEW